MKKWLAISLPLLALTLSAVEIPFHRKPMEVTLETKGGGISMLKWKGHLFNAPGTSFTERVICDTTHNGNKAIVQENFHDLEFTPRMIRNTWNEFFYEFSTRGTGAFDWLRITKTYKLNRIRDHFYVEYKLENLDNAPHSAALWVRTFLRDYQNSRARNIFVQGHTRQFTHPGDAKSDEWCVTPKYPVTAAYGSESKKGAVIEVPYKVSHAFYSWFSMNKPISTTEFITREISLKAKEKYSFTLKVTVGDRVPGLLKAMLKKAPAAGVKAGKASYAPAEYAAGRLPRILQQRSGNTVKLSANSMNLTVPRQFHDSVREVILPANADLSRLGIYEVANDRADYSREVPFVLEKRNGKNMVRFPVPGFKHNYLLTKLDSKNRVYRDKSGNFISFADYKIQICFDRAATKKYSPDSIGKAGLFTNSDFSKADAKGRAAGWVHPCYYWVRGNYALKNGVFQLSRPKKAPTWAQFWECFAAEPGRKYTLSVRLRNDNLAKGTAAASVSFFDAAGKGIRGSGTRVYDSKVTHDWKTYKVSFYAPEKAAFGRFSLVLNGLKDQTISIDDLTLIPEPYSPETVKLVDRLRDQLKSSWYKPLDLIERNSHAVETKHEKWFKPAGFTMPDILFLPFCNANYSSLERRQIVEVNQRMPIKYTMIPLLARVASINGSGIMGVYHATTLPELEPYTLERLKSAPKTKVIWISGLNFKKHVKAPFLNFLRQRAKDSDLLFYNCFNIPAEFLGKKAALPKEIAVIPRMRPAADRNFSKVVQFYTRGKRRSCTLDMRYQNRGNNPVVPGIGLANPFDNFTGREFPYWEFEYLTVTKALRHLAQVTPDASITDAKAGQMTIRAAKNMKASLEIRYEDLSRQTIGTKIVPCQLKKGNNVVKFPMADGRFGEYIAYLKLKGPKGYLDGAGIKLKGANTLPVKIAFPSGKVQPFGKSMPVTVSLDQKLPGAVLEVTVEDAEYRQVAKYTSKGETLKFAFTPSFPRTVLYRVLVAVKEKGQVIARSASEFTFSGNNNDPKELVAVIWSGADSIKYPMYKALGFDHLITWCLNTLNPTRVLRNLNMDPVVYGSGSVAFGFNSWHQYRGDTDTSQKLSARKPCFSDPAAWKSAAANIANQAKRGLFAANDVKFHMIGDEQFLGRNVCISEHCLKAFRNEMKAYYKNIAKLNADWGTNFASFDKIMPQTVTELKDKSKLGTFIPHKLFMTRLFAEKYMGGMRRELKKSSPSTIIGLSGTANPGYHFDWPLVMKQLDYLAFYDGIQRKLAHDFANPGALGGQWFGGYVLPTHHEGYVNSIFWRDLLSGNRLSANYGPHAGITGDLLLTPQLEYHSKLLKESRTGIAKLIFSAKEKNQVALIYSQSSLFAAAATIGMSEYENTLSGWHALLGDLGIDHQFLYAPEIVKTLDKRFKVVILPAALALSDTEIATLRRFAANGGTVIADMEYAVYNEHGTLRKGKNVPVIRSVKLPQGEFRTTTKGNRFFTAEKVGKGQIITMNVLVSGYQQTILGGVGGEVARELTGSEKFCATMRDIVKKDLAKGGIHRTRYLTGRNGKPRQAETVWREYNNCGLFGIWKFDRQIKRLDPKRGETVTVTIPRKGHIYNVRTKKYVGYGNQFKYRLHSGGADLFAVLPQKPGALTVTAPADMVKGRDVKFTIALPGAGRVFYCELFDPAGKKRYSRTLAAPDGRTGGSFQIAFNDPAGQWKLRITDAATGTARTRNLKLK